MIALEVASNRLVKPQRQQEPGFGGGRKALSPLRIALCFFQI